jgi:hypothetical protein
MILLSPGVEGRVKGNAASVYRSFCLCRRCLIGRVACVPETMLAPSALAALGGRGHADAFSTLSALAERATRQPRRRLAS